MTLLSHWTLPDDAGAPPPAPIEIIDARRCTVQMSNGYLYLDAAAAPAHALLGHEPRVDDAEPVETARALDALSGVFACSAILPDLEAAIEHARGLPLGGDAGSAAEIVDAADGEPPEGRAPLIVIENASLGRSGRWLASEGWKRKPTVVVVGETLSRGLPFGAVLIAANDARRSAPASPVSGGVSQEVDRTIAAVAAGRLLAAVPPLELYLRNRLRSVQATAPAIAMIDFGPFRASISLRDGGSALTLKRRLCERGVLVATDEAGRIVIAPPLVIRPAEIDVIAGALRGVLNGTPTWRPAACCPACEAPAPAGEERGRFTCA